MLDILGKDLIFPLLKLNWILTRLFLLTVKSRVKVLMLSSCHNLEKLLWTQILITEMIYLIMTEQLTSMDRILGVSNTEGLKATPVNISMGREVVVRVMGANLSTKNNFKEIEFLLRKWTG